MIGIGWIRQVRRRGCWSHCDRSVGARSWTGHICRCGFWLVRARVVLSSRLSCRPYRGVVVPFTSVYRRGKIISPVSYNMSFGFATLRTSLGAAELRWFADPCPRRRPIHVQSYGLNPTPSSPLTRAGYPNLRVFLRLLSLLSGPSTRPARSAAILVYGRTTAATTGYPCSCKWPTLDVGQLCKGPRRTLVTTHRRHHRLPARARHTVSVPAALLSSSSLCGDFGHTRLRLIRTAITLQR